MLITLLAAFALVASGCNTFRGMGQDLEKAGSAIQDVAN
jgi:predicted small secreted protein